MSQTLFSRWLDLPEGWINAVLPAQLGDAFQPTKHYWLLLLVSLGIAALGLVTNSTASVIGAMLVAPLMGPIQQVGIGLATGSVILISMSVLRVLASVIGSVFVAALLVYLLPFHDVTDELRGRTSPQALDLGIALLCGFVASYVVTCRKDAVTAAGISIAISLVPPLATVGFGVGTSDWNIAIGASLLFVTNLAAILLSTSLFFVALGAASVDIGSIEDSFLEAREKIPVVARLALRLRKGRASTRAHVLRLALPILLILALFGPLWIGLKKVSREVFIRQTIGQILSLHLKDEQVLSQKLVLSKTGATLILSIVGDTDRQEELKKKLSDAFAQNLSEEVRLFLYGISDATSIEAQLSRLEERQELALLALKTAQAPASVPAPKPEPLTEMPTRLWTEVTRALAASWPSSSTPVPTSVELRLTNSTPTLVVISATALSPDAVELLSKQLSKELSMPIQIITEIIPEALFLGNDQEFLAAWPSIKHSAERALSLGDHLEIVSPLYPPTKKPSAPQLAAKEKLQTLLDMYPNQHTLKVEGDAWKLTFIDKPSTSLPAQSATTNPAQ
jgi:uncharacterized hydrophobic protein (TIGR00271 family)